MFFVRSSVYLCSFGDLRIYFVNKIIYRVRYIADSIFCGGTENRYQILLEVEGVKLEL